MRHLGWKDRVSGFSNRLLLTISSNTVITVNFGVPEVRLLPQRLSPNGKFYISVAGPPGVAFNDQHTTKLLNWEFSAAGSIRVGGSQNELAGSMQQHARFHHTVVAASPQTSHRRSAGRILTNPPRSRYLRGSCG